MLVTGTSKHVPGISDICHLENYTDGFFHQVYLLEVAEKQKAFFFKGNKKKDLKTGFKTIFHLIFLANTF